MAITINGKTYRNLQEQVEENVKDIEDLQENQFSGDYNDLTNKPDLSNVVTKDDAGNIDGILQVEQLQSEEWDEDDDCKANIYLTSGLRKSTIVLNTEGEETGSSIILQGTTSVGSEGTVEISGKTNFTTDNRITVTDSGDDSEDIAYLSDISSAVTSKQDTLVSGTNIKTINNQSLLGSGNINMSGGDVLVADYGIQIAPLQGSLYIGANITTDSRDSLYINNGSNNDKVISVNSSVVAYLSDLATVATTGAYSDLSGKPNLEMKTYEITVRAIDTNSKTMTFSKVISTFENINSFTISKMINYCGNLYKCVTSADTSNYKLNASYYLSYYEDPTDGSLITTEPSEQRAHRMYLRDGDDILFTSTQL